MIAKISFCAFLTAALLGAVSSPAYCEVRFGANVFVGSHDFSNQTFDHKHRAEVHLYESRPQNAGCRWRADASGRRVKVCRLRNLH